MSGREIGGTVRVGVVGTSAHVEAMHLAPLANYPRATLAALCGRNSDRAGRVAAKFGVPLTFADYREFIQRGELDAVIIASPDDWHHAMTLDALAAGLHVLCEKPLGLDARQAQEMYRRAEEVGVKHMTNFSWRWLPHHRYLRRLVQEGYLGRCFGAEFHFLHGFGRTASYDWRFDQQRANGVLADLGSHVIDLARWLVGDVCRVACRANAFVERSYADGTHPVPANDTAQLLVDFANGAQGLVNLSAVAEVADRGVEQRVTLHGSDGTLEAFYSRLGATVRGVRKNGTSFETLAIPDEFWGDANRDDPFDVFQHQSVGDRLFVDAILDDQPLRPSFADGVRVQQVIDAALEANRLGQWVEVGLGTARGSYS